MPKTMTELRTQLSEVVEQLRQDDIELKIAREIVNTAGKIIASCTVQLHYAELRNEDPNIPFLHDVVSAAPKKLPQQNSRKQIAG
jgi:hypothetical protein